MSSRNLKWAIYTLYMIGMLHLVSVFIGAYQLATGAFKSVIFVNIPNVVNEIVIGTLILGVAFSLWTFLTAQRLKTFKKSAWKHSIIISIVAILDVNMIPLSLFIIYCLTDQNVRFLFKNEIIRISK